MASNLLFESVEGNVEWVIDDALVPFYTKLTDTALQGFEGEDDVMPSDYVILSDYLEAVVSHHDLSGATFALLPNPDDGAEERYFRAHDKNEAAYWVRAINNILAAVPQLADEDDEQEEDNKYRGEDTNRSERSAEELAEREAAAATAYQKQQQQQSASNLASTGGAAFASEEPRGRSAKANVAEEDTSYVSNNEYAPYSSSSYKAGNYDPLSDGRREVSEALQDSAANASAYAYASQGRQASMLAPPAPSPPKIPSSRANPQRYRAAEDDPSGLTHTPRTATSSFATRDRQPTASSKTMPAIRTTTLTTHDEYRQEGVPPVQPQARYNETDAWVRNTTASTVTPAAVEKLKQPAEKTIANGRDGTEGRFRPSVDPEGPAADYERVPSASSFRRQQSRHTNVSESPSQLGGGWGAALNASGPSAARDRDANRGAGVGLGGGRGEEFPSSGPFNAARKNKDSQPSTSRGIDEYGYVNEDGRERREGGGANNNRLPLRSQDPNSTFGQSQSPIYPSYSRPQPQQHPLDESGNSQASSRLQGQDREQHYRHNNAGAENESDDVYYERRNQQTKGLRGGGGTRVRPPNANPYAAAADGRRRHDTFDDYGYEGDGRRRGGGGGKEAYGSDDEESRQNQHDTFRDEMNQSDPRDRTENNNVSAVIGRKRSGMFVNVPANQQLNTSVAPNISAMWKQWVDETSGDTYVFHEPTGTLQCRPAGSDVFEVYVVGSEDIPAEDLASHPFPHLQPDDTICDMNGHVVRNVQNYGTRRAGVGAVDLTSADIYRTDAVMTPRGQYSPSRKSRITIEAAPREKPTTYEGRRVHHLSLSSTGDEAVVEHSVQPLDPKGLMWDPRTGQTIDLTDRDGTNARNVGQATLYKQWEHVRGILLQGRYFKKHAVNKATFSYRYAFLTGDNAYVVCVPTSEVMLNVHTSVRTFNNVADTIQYYGRDAKAIALNNITRVTLGSEENSISRRKDLKPQNTFCIVTRTHAFILECETSREARFFADAWNFFLFHSNPLNIQAQRTKQMRNPVTHGTRAGLAF